uniref:ATP-dependent DNA ligase family profile domain-containing protein n=1 Tax=Arcella intermedia TaxID=1963864 RepID=A0A6B2LEQ1_9EUKA
MHGHEWNGEQDPTGWIISEKLDGLRAFWDGKRLFSKRGQPILAPVDFTGPLPSGTCLDGELWIDYGCFNTISSMYRKSHLANNADLWRDVKYCVFDVPMHSGDYRERHSFVRDVISGCGTHVCLVPIIDCLGHNHLETVLNEITQKKGEGLMLYHPSSKYTSGRTTNLLKVKAFMEEDVKFIEYNPNSYSFLCLQQNGVECVVKCSVWDYLFPPPPGTVLTVKHSGISETSQRLKYPFLFRIRPDITWEHTQRDS